MELPEAIKERISSSRYPHCKPPFSVEGTKNPRCFIVIGSTGANALGDFFFDEVEAQTATQLMNSFGE